MNELKETNVRPMQYLDVLLNRLTCTFILLSYGFSHNIYVGFISLQKML